MKITEVETIYLRLPQVRDQADSGQDALIVVWRLLGGGFHAKIRAYASLLFGDTPEEIGERGRRVVGRGFTAVKFGWGLWEEDEASDLALVREAG
jgi:L-alanine-DL-glutamate epimerase-like enolase superfamily enzyme